MTDQTRPIQPKQSSNPDQISVMPRTEPHSLQRGICPDCGHDRFYLGPRGAAARNIECAGPGCGSRFNVAIHEGKLVFAQRIPSGERTGAFWEPRARSLL